MLPPLDVAKKLPRDLLFGQMSLQAAASLLYDLFEAWFFIAAECLWAAATALTLNYVFM